MNVPVSSYQDEQHSLQEFLENLNTFDNLVKNINVSLHKWVILPNLLYNTWKFNRMTQNLIHNIRNIMDTCKTDCKKNIECLNTFYDVAKEIRDIYFRLFKDISEIPFISEIPLLSFFLRDMIEKSLADWDDLVEDCFVGYDREFKDLIMQIANSA